MKICRLFVVLTLCGLLILPTAAIAGTWTAKADMPTGRMGLSASVVDRVIFAIAVCVKAFETL